MTAMEGILDLYGRPEDPRYPVVCVDETSKQHLQEMRPPLPLMPGKPYRYDPEYKRNGVSNLFMIFAPFSGFDMLKSLTNARAWISHISAEISSMCIFQRLKRFCWFATISIRINPLRCIRRLNLMKPSVLLKSWSFTIPRSMAVG